MSQLFISCFLLCFFHHILLSYFIHLHYYHLFAMITHFYVSFLYSAVLWLMRGGVLYQNMVLFLYLYFLMMSRLFIYIFSIYIFSHGFILTHQPKYVLTTTIYTFTHTKLYAPWGSFLHHPQTSGFTA